MVLAALAAATTLGACGGGGGEPGGDAATLAGAAPGGASPDGAKPEVGTDITRSMSTTVTAPLIADDGTAMPSDPRARPADAAAWTTSGRYATVAQAHQLLAAQADAMVVEVRCCGAEAADEAVGIAWGVQAAGDKPDDMPVLVRGDDLRLAAAVANRLASGGLTRVWLVTP
jgi:hypothetical protein